MQGQSSRLVKKHRGTPIRWWGGVLGLFGCLLFSWIDENSLLLCILLRMCPGDLSVSLSLLGLWRRIDYKSPLQITLTQESVWAKKPNTACNPSWALGRFYTLKRIFKLLFMYFFKIIFFYIFFNVLTW
jgi:hypothetical protein